MESLKRPELGFSKNEYPFMHFSLFCGNMVDNMMINSSNAATVLILIVSGKCNYHTILMPTYEILWPLAYYCLKLEWIST